MSQRLRQPCLSSLCWAKKPGGSPALPPASAQLSWWTNQSSSTMSHSCGHILSFFLSFFSFFDFLSCCFTMGTARERELSVFWQCLVCHGHPHTCTVQRKQPPDTYGSPSINTWQLAYIYSIIDPDHKNGATICFCNKWCSSVQSFIHFF